MSRLSSISSASSTRRRWLVVQAAASSGDLETLRKVSPRDCTLRSPNEKTTALHAASIAGQLAALRLLAEKGAKVDSKDVHGNTALHMAVINGQSDCVSFLVHFGANLWCLNDQLETALDVAIRCGRQDLVRFLDTNASQQLLRNPKATEKLRQRAALSADRKMRKKPCNGVDDSTMTSYDSSPGWAHPDLFAWKTRALPTMRLRTAPDALSMTSLQPYTTLTLSSALGGRYNRTTRPSGDVDTVSGNDGMGGMSRPEVRKSPSTPALSISSEFSLYCHVSDSVADGETREPQDVAVVRRPGPAADHRRKSLLGTAAPIFSDRSRVRSPSTLTGSMTSSLLHPVDGIDATYSEPYDSSSTDVHSNSSNTKAFVRLNAARQTDAIVANGRHHQAPVRRRLAAKMAEFLTELDLQEYIPRLCRERIDMHSLFLLTDDDLKQLGVPLGPRRTLMSRLQLVGATNEENSVDTHL